MFLQQQISILEWFMKDLVTLKIDILEYYNRKEFFKIVIIFHRISGGGGGYQIKILYYWL